MAALLLYALYLRVLTLLPNPAMPLALRSMEDRALFTEAVSTEGRLDLNTATLEELMALPGIGEKTAAAILAFREEIGGFHYAEDLLRVRGIGSGKLNAIYDLICVRPIQERNNSDGNTGSFTEIRRPAAQDAGL